MEANTMVRATEGNGDLVKLCWLVKMERRKEDGKRIVTNERERGLSTMGEIDEDVIVKNSALSNIHFTVLSHFCPV